MIKVLDKDTIEKIAAGEVIERPQNVVKELIENSIDANAKNITIEIKDGGLSLIRVRDDGDGFYKNDLSLAFKRYATSKIDDIEDMYSVDTFGFRGEALSSISIISSMTIKSKRKEDDIGYTISSEYGVESDIDTTTKNDGTEIIIKNLFEKLPVRRKALDNDAKETSKIIDIIEKEALANPSVSFKVIVDDREKLNIKGTGKLQDVIHDIYGRDVSNNILPIDDIYNDIKVMGYIGKPSIMRSNRNDEIYFVNNRYIKSKVIEQALDDAYKTFLMQHKYPLVVLMIKLKDGDVDVNVHPRKQEVLFKNDSEIYNAIYTLVRKALDEKELIHESKDDGIYLHDEIKKTAYKTSIDFSKIINQDMSFKDFITKEREVEESIQDKIDREKDLEDRRLIKKDISTDYHIIGQIFDTYIIISYDDNIYLIDQHAAHEKINFEKLKKELSDRLDGTLESEMLLVPIMISLTKNQQEIIEKYRDTLEKMGFAMEHFGDNDYKISSVPMILSKIDKKELLMELVRDLEIDYKNGKKVNDIDIFLDRIASMSCKMSIKANDRLSLSDMKNLIDKLFSLDNPYNCPHGRPAIIKVTREELEKKFKRIV